MDTLPLTIPVVDLRWAPQGENAAWQRVEAKDRKLLEEHIDALVCAHANTIADSLRGAGVLEEGTELLVLGTQVDNVDVVLAEVDEHGRAFRRLVLVEDKLFRNAQATRSVLAQIVEYGHMAQNTWRTSSLPTLFTKADSGWLERNAADIDESLRRGEYLLLVVGDRINRNLATLARRFAAQESPLNLSELAVMSLGLYRRGNEVLVIPHVTSAVTLTDRTTTIQVKVEGASAGPLRASVTARTDVPVRSKEEGAPEGAQQFLVKLAGQLDPEMTAVGWLPTKKPRKQLAYWVEYEDTEEGGRGTRVSCAIHHGVYTPEWRPLTVYVDVTARSTAQREQIRSLFDEKLAKKLLPPGTEVVPSGVVMLTARVDLDWAEPEDLNEAFAAQVLTVFRRLRDGLVPLVAP